MIYDINKFYDMFTNIDKEIIDIVCEQNIDPNLIFDKLLEISNNNPESIPDTPISYIIDQPIEIEDYISSNDEINDNVSINNNTNSSKDNQTKCPCLNLKSLYNTSVEKNHNIKYTKVNTIDSDDEDYDELFKL
tara:strand:- start:1183 stop:1584 length:402 start_codon:yes stop_codon:yes gene_type:complete